jgi:hypothetical protein
MAKSNPVNTHSAVPVSPGDSVQMQESFVLLKSASARKLGKHAQGEIHYQMLCDTARQILSLAITGNDDGGYFSREVLSFHKVEACLSSREQDARFPSKVLKEIFTGRSSNNAGFLAAILRAEALIAPAPDMESQHVVCGDRTAWKSALLALAGQAININPSLSRSQETLDDEAPEDINPPTARRIITLNGAKPATQPESE